MAENRQTRRKLDPDSLAADGMQRMCAVTRVEASPETLIRFVRSPSGELTPDLSHRLPGRGVWIDGTRKTLEKAVKTKAFARSLHADVAVPADFIERLDELLVRRATDALALANKAGAVICGFQQVDAALEKDGVGILVHGSDAAQDGRGKLDRKFRAIQGENGRKASIIDNLTSAEMSLAIGRPSVVHAALIPGGLAKRFQREAERTQRFRSLSVPDQALATSFETNAPSEG